jgi:hypothetical protein
MLHFNSLRIFYTITAAQHISLTSGVIHIRSFQGLFTKPEGIKLK